MYKDQKTKIASKIFLLMLLIGLSINYPLKAQSTDENSDFKLSSPAFTDQGNYPKLYTCDSSAYSPPVNFEHIPKNAKMLAITMTHIAKDGDQHVYWVFYNIPVNTSEIAENSKYIGLLGHNTMNRNLAYSPPCSKGPGEKTYTLTAYAVSKNVTNEGLVLADFLTEIKDDIIAKSALTVKYSR